MHLVCWIICKMGKQKRKKRDNILAWDYPLFRKRYQRENNLNVEQTRLLKDDDETTLIYIHVNGDKTEYTAKQFFEEKLYKVLPAVSDGLMMAWDYPEFRGIYQKENNPGTNPRTLRKKDRTTAIHYTNPYGFKFDFYANDFFQNKLWEKYPYKRFEMAMDYKVFRDIYQPHNNPGVDPYTIRKWDKDTDLIYVNPYGLEIPYTADRFFAYKLWETMPFKKLEMAMDYKEFSNRFQQENNLGVNPYSIRKWDRDIELKYMNPYGLEIPYTADRFFSYRLWETIDDISDKMAMYYSEFATRFQQENNPEVNPYTIRKWDRKRTLYYINQHNVRIPYTAFRFFKERMWETMDSKGDPNKKKIRIRRAPLSERKKPVYKKHEMAMNYKEFREIFQQENNPGVDPYTIRKWDKKIRLIYINSYGVLIPYTPDYFFRKELWKTMPQRKPKNGMLANALELDDEIELYVATEERNKLLEVDIFSPMAFNCPFCGSAFTKRLVDMINVSPKCPFCDDTGLYKEVGDEEINGAFLKYDGRSVREEDTGL